MILKEKTWIILNPYGFKEKALIGGVKYGNKNTCRGRV
jgi:hypothetical protein